MDPKSDKFLKKSALYTRADFSLLQQFCQAAGDIGAALGCDGLEGGVIHFRRVICLIGNGPQDHKGNAVEVGGLGDGRTGGFVALSSEDVAEIYRIAAKATL